MLLNMELTWETMLQYDMLLQAEVHFDILAGGQIAVGTLQLS